MKEPDGRSLEDFYAANYRRLVRGLVLVTGSRESAEEAVQEAFARLVPRWRKVRDHPDPVAWVRRVALNLVTDTQRRQGVQRRFLSRHRVADHAQDQYPSEDSFAAQLSDLPLAQRKILVLRYVYDLSTDEIAAELGISVSAVKSRLHRARQALLPTLTEGTHHV